MNQDPDPSATRAATVQLVLAHQAELDLTRARDALRDLDWLGSPEVNPPVQEEWRRVNTTLALLIADGSAPGPVRKSALVDIGPPDVFEEAILVGVGWQSDSMAPLFPVFAGQLRITQTGLFLEGRYAPPFGRLGLLIDERILHFIARRTGQAFLARLAARIEA